MDLKTAGMDRGPCGSLHQEDFSCLQGLGSSTALVLPILQSLEVTAQQLVCV
jgi:hypothetical protein